MRPVDCAVLGDRACRHAVGQERRLVGPLVIIKGRGALTEVGAGAIGAVARSGKDHRAHAVVGVALVERGDDLDHHLGGEGVHPVGAVQRQQRYAFMLVEANLVEAHLSLPWLRPSSQAIRRSASSS